MLSASANPLSSKKDLKPSDSVLDVSKDLISSHAKVAVACSRDMGSERPGEKGRLNGLGIRLSTP